MYTGMIDKDFMGLRFNPCRPSDRRISHLANLGHPAAWVIREINNAIRGKDADIYSSLAEATYGKDNSETELLFNTVWFYYAGNYSAVSSGSGAADFASELAYCFEYGENSFPVSKNASLLLYKAGLQIYSDRYQMELIEEYMRNS